jgi:uroporphyrinogen-III synthase
MLAPLDGFTIGVTADRRADEQADLFLRRGASVLRGPSIRTVPLGPDAALRAATEQIVADPPDYVVATTGIGVRGWLTMAETWGIEGDLVRALARTRLLARGPKAAGALQSAGLEVWWRAPGEEFREVVAHLLGQSLAGARIAVQEPGAPVDEAAAPLVAAGASVLAVPVYRWQLPEDRSGAQRLLTAVCERRVDALTFTAAPALSNFFLIAHEEGALPALRDAVDDGLVVACIGPVCSDAARAHGVPDPVEPVTTRLGSMVRAVTDRLAERARHFDAAGLRLVLQGSTVLVDDRRVELTSLERLVLESLAERPGAVVSPALLLRRVWGTDGGDEHTVEVAIGRLRRRIGRAGAAIRTVRRRGYRFDAEPHIVPESA